MEWTCALLLGGVGVGLADLDGSIGLDRLRALHVNDSAAPLGSNRDRHANIGDGLIGDALGAFLAHPAFQHLCAYLETPGPGDGTDAEELRKVRRVADRDPGKVTEVLAAVAGLLARESKGLLIGERADQGVIAKVRNTLAAWPGVDAVNHVRTIHTAPDSIFVAISADFADSLSMGEAEAMIEDMEARLRADEPRLASIYIRPEKRRDAVVTA